MAIASAIAITMLAAGCSSSPGNGAAKLKLENASIRLQRVVSAMARFGLLPQQDKSFKTTSVIGD